MQSHLCQLQANLNSKHRVQQHASKNRCHDLKLSACCGCHVRHAQADLDSNYQTAHKRVQEALQRESKLAVDKVQAAECEVVRARNRQ